MVYPSLSLLICQTTNTYLYISALFFKTDDFSKWQKYNKKDFFIGNVTCEDTIPGKAEIPGETKM